MSYFGSFEKTSKIAKAVFQEVLGDKDVRSLLQVVDNIENYLEYMWKYIDYGFRVPIFRNMQWVWYGPEYRERSVIEMQLLEVNVHLLKEYLQTWFTLLDVFKNIRDLESILRRIAKETDTKIDEHDIKGATGELKGGISAELKACYVLLDHGKPFLPFSIMQAPIVPSVIRLTASGDLYLFEENLVIDVKSGWLEGVEGLGKLPRYYYSKGPKLLNDLRKCRDTGRLYGIRKGVGVVAEDSEKLYLATYVPWRYRGEPLLCFESIKLPFLTYIHRKNFETYAGELKNSSFLVELDVFLVSREKSLWVDNSKWDIFVYRIGRDSKGREKLFREPRQGRMTFRHENKEFYTLKIEVQVNKEDKITYRGVEYLALDLVHKDKALKVPVLALVKS